MLVNHLFTVISNLLLFDGIIVTPFAFLFVNVLYCLIMVVDDGDDYGDGDGVTSDDV